MKESPLQDMVCHTCKGTPLYRSTLATHEGHRIQVFNITAYRVFREICPQGMRIAILLGQYVTGLRGTRWVA